MIRSLIYLLFLCYSTELLAQTCCSGGVPVSSNLGFQSEEAKIWQLSVSADFNFLKTLKSGSETLDDDQRLRTTQSYILRSAYSLNSRWTIEGFLPLVRQTRRITSLNGSEDKESTFGLGDPVALLIYNVINKGVVFRLGAGPQIPLGGHNQTNSRGLILLEDLQPGSGAWDLILMASLEYSLKNRPSSTLYLNAITSRTGVNPESRGGAQSYEFGNDIQLIGGISDQVLLFNQIFSSGVSVRYRHANRDLVNSNELPGTGGDFFFGRASVGIPFPKLKSSFNINVEFPLWSSVNETQLAPSFVLNFGWFKKIEPKLEYETLIDIN